jgi:ribosome-binding protein aMBF1 (putative translation factor)
MQFDPINFVKSPTSGRWMPRKEEAERIEEALEVILRFATSDEERQQANREWTK